MFQRADALNLKRLRKNGLYIRINMIIQQMPVFTFWNMFYEYAANNISDYQ